MNRPKYSAFVGISIDGYIAKNDGDVSWLDQFSSTNEDCGYRDFFDSIDGIVMGRRTYEKCVTFEPWPCGDKKVVVLSNTLTSGKKGVQLFNDSLSKLNDKLNLEGNKHIYVDGGITISHFLNAKLLDHMTITIVPILLGSGLKLFSALSSEVKPEFVSSKSFSAGIIQLKYNMAYD